MDPLQHCTLEQVPLHIIQECSHQVRCKCESLIRTLRHRHVVCVPVWRQLDSVAARGHHRALQHAARGYSARLPPARQAVSGGTTCARDTELQRAREAVTLVASRGTPVVGALQYTATHLHPQYIIFVVFCHTCIVLSLNVASGTSVNDITA